MHRKKQTTRDSLSSHNIFKMGVAPIDTNLQLRYLQKLVWVPKERVHEGYLIFFEWHVCGHSQAHIHGNIRAYIQINHNFDGQ
jgi:hypothetical protein